MLTWRAVYDGDEVEAEKYQRIDRERLVEFQLVHDSGGVAFACAVSGDELVYRRRTQLHVVGDNEVAEVVWHMVACLPRFVAFVHDETCVPIIRKDYGDPPFDAPVPHEGEPCLTT